MRERLVPFLAFLAAACLAFLFSRVEQVRALEGSLYDRFTAWHEAEAADPRVVVIGIDPESMAALGPFPWPRSVHGRLLRLLKARGARVVFFDLVFDAPGAHGPADDQEFARALRDCGNAVLASEVGEADARANRVAPLLPEFARFSRIGVINRKRDADGVIRWGILAVAAVDPPPASAALQMFRSLRPDAEVRLAPRYVSVGEFRIPTSGTEPYEVPIRYRLPRPVLSYHRVLGGDLRGADLKDSLVLVGLYDPRSGVDTFQTPAGQRAGVQVHAALLDTLLGGRFVQRLRVEWDFLAILALGSVAAVLVRRAPSVLLGVAAALGLGAAWLAVDLALLGQGWWIGPAGPIMGACLALGTTWALRFRRARRLLTQFVAADQVGAMLQSDEAARLGGSEQLATVFFTDIRGYTTLSESRSPVEVMDLLNQYHSRVGEIYARFGGVVMTYQGDAQIVLFEHGRRGAGPAVAAAVQAGLEMQEAVAGLRQRWTLGPGERFEVGVGICSGSVSVALVGSQEHKQFTVLGDTVRKASDVQGLSASLEAPVLLDQASRDLAGDRLQVEALAPVQLAGRGEPVCLYRARGSRAG